MKNLILFVFIFGTFTGCFSSSKHEIAAESDGGGSSGGNGGNKHPYDMSASELVDYAFNFVDSVFKAGSCVIKGNPHSYPCTVWTYQGEFFPLFPMDWDSLQGTWFSVTYVNPTSGNEGPQFLMKKNPARPMQPMGVENTRSGQAMGHMSIQGDLMRIENWLGIELVLQVDGMVDSNTIRLVTPEAFGFPRHTFTCRDFNRNNNHHLLCDWEEQRRPDESWQHKGFFGFLTMSAWNNFLRNGVRR
ncbi:hypothetical protein K2X05_10070 [bacterium]|nr:hypothetical protein [bacterium]